MIIGIDASRAFATERTGTENYSYHVIKDILRLPESRQHTFVLFIRPNAQIPDWVREKHVVIKPIKFRYLWTQVGLASATWNTRLDRLWIPAHTLPILRKRGLKTIVTIHGLEYQWLPEYNNWLQRWYLPLSTMYAARAATALIAVSAYTRDQLVKELHTDLKRIKVVHEGVELSDIKSIKVDQDVLLSRYNLVSKPYILFVGTVQPRKNVQALIQAFAKIHAQFPDHQLVLAGSIGWMVHELFSLPGSLGIQEKVIWTGRVSEEVLQVLYAHASLYVQPSHTEGFGLPLFEAMQYQAPVVSSDGGALPEVLGEAGVVVHLGRSFVSDLAEAMKQVLPHSTLRRSMIVAGQKRVATFSWTVAARKTLSVIENI